MIVLKKKKELRYYSKKERLEMIFSIFNKKRPSRTLKGVMRKYRRAFNEVERRTSKLNDRYHKLRGGLTEKQRRRMIMCNHPDWSLDLHGVYFSRYEYHCLIASKNGALSIYKKINHEWGMISAYMKEEPLFYKLGRNGKDVFGRKVEKTA